MNLIIICLGTIITVYGAISLMGKIDPSFFILFSGLFLIFSGASFLFQNEIEKLESKIDSNKTKFN